MSNDQPVGNVVPPGRSVAMRMARTATARSARRSNLMAHSGAVIEERATLHGQEFPRVGPVEQRQPEQPVRVAVALLAVGGNRAEEILAVPAGAHDELADAALRVPLAVGRLGREALVKMLVSVEYDLRVSLVERLPQRPQIHLAAVVSRAEPGVMPHREGAGDPVRGEGGAQPLLLRGPGGDVIGAVQHDDMPGAELVTVVTPAKRPGCRAEIVVVGGSGAGLVFMIPRRGACAPFLASPGRIVTVGVILIGAVGVGVVPQSENRSVFLIEPGRGFLIAQRRTAGDVPGADEHE